MSSEDRVRWDVRHAAADDVGPMPPDALRGREHLLPPGGCALDVACGRGAVARWLAARGFCVDAVDVSPVGLAALAGVPGVRTVLHDLDLGLPAAGPYDVVVCQRFRDPALYPVLRAALVPGGLLVITVLSVVDEGPGPFRAAPGELRAAFRGTEVLAAREGGGEASLIARAGGAPAPGSPPPPPAPS